MKLFPVSVILLSFSISMAVFIPVTAAEANQNSRPCGIGRWSLITPQLFLKGACDNHDRCRQSGASRNVCAERFYEESLATCNQIDDQKEKKLTIFTNRRKKAFCLDQATAYYNAIRAYDNIKK